MSIADKLVTAASNVPKVYAAGQRSVGTAETVSGNPAVLELVCPAEHAVSVELSSKNLIPYPYKNTTQAVNGVAFTDNGDGSITLNGTSTAQINWYLTETNAIVLSTGVYYVSLNPTQEGITALQMTIAVGGPSATVNGKALWLQTLGNALTVSKEGTIGDCLIIIQPGVALENCVIRPQIEKGTAATAYTPYVSDFSAVQVKRYGKNLFDVNNTKFVNYYNTQSYAKDGNTYTVHGVEGVASLAYSSGELRVGLNNTMATTGKNVTVSMYVTLLEQGKYNEFMGCWLCDNNVTAIAAASRSAALTLNERVRWSVSISNVGNDVGGLLFRLNNNKVVIELDTLQVEYGDTATEYQTYTCQPVTANADGMVEGLTSVSPTTSLTADNEGVIVKAGYYLDAQKRIAELEEVILTLGGDV